MEHVREVVQHCQKRVTSTDIAHDTKVFRCVSSQDQKEKLRSDLVSLFLWSEGWLMLF